MPMKHKETANYVQPVDTDAPGLDSVTISYGDSTDPVEWQAVSGQDNTEGTSEKEAEVENKFFMEIGPTSFSELDSAREAQKKDMRLKRILSDFMSLVGNIINFPSDKGAAADVKALIKEMDELIPEEGMDGEEEKAISAESAGGKRLFTIWKDDVTGEYRWLGVYSNKFRDDDNPAEILAEKAHLRFIERVEKGELEYPDLYIWHIPVPVGKADLLAYDDAGFSIASGTIEEDFAIALMKTSLDLAMSHGMPARYIRRDDIDKTVITDYVSTEVSVLPRFAAANKMTDFYVLDEEEAKMAIIPDKKRQQVAALLGQELTEELESDLLARSDKAIAEDVEFKGEEQQVEEEQETEDNTEEVKTEETVEETVEGSEEQVAETEDVTEEIVAESDVDVPAEEPAGEAGQQDREELADTLVAIVGAITKQNQQVLDAIAQVNARVDVLEGGIGELQKSDGEKVAQLAAGTPEASLQSLVQAQLAGTVIGNPATRVHGNSSLAKEGPEETPHDEEETEEGYTGLFFKNW